MTTVEWDDLDTELTGATIVTVVPAPAAGKTRIVKCLRLNNLSTAAITAILYRTTSGTDREVTRVKDLPPTNPDGGEPWVPIDQNRPMGLKPTQSLRMVLTGASVNASPVAFADWMEATNS